MKLKKSQALPTVTFRPKPRVQKLLERACKQHTINGLSARIKSHLINAALEGGGLPSLLRKKRRV